MMEKKYAEDELLSLSGIQHFRFCKRQWALIHIERQWEENLRTTEGHFLHERVDDPFLRESRGDVSESRAFSGSVVSILPLRLVDVVWL